MRFSLAENEAVASV